MTHTCIYLSMIDEDVEECVQQQDAVGSDAGGVQKNRLGGGGGVNSYYTRYKVQRATVLPLLEHGSFDL